MVYRGPSRGCATCKQRRVKCDEAKPACRACHRLGILCEGYKKKPTRLRFWDENHKFPAAGAEATAAPRSRSLSKARNNGVIQRNHQVAVLSPPAPRPLSEPDTSVPFFLGHYASMGRDLGSTRGFFELLIPAYRAQRADSPLSVTISAVSGEILSLWRHGARDSQTPSAPYARAVACIREAVQDPEERAKTATVLAVLALQLYENVAAVFGFRPVTPIHHNGAVSLLPLAESDHGPVSAYIRRFLLHTEVSSAIRQKRPLQKIAHSWIGSRDPGAPENPSSVLDAIGASVADLQASYVQLGAHNARTAQDLVDECRAKAQRIDEHLLVWAQNVPAHWQPLKLAGGQDIDASVPTYRSTCEVYPSSQIATIWNIWRLQRLLLAKITLGCLEGTPSEHTGDAPTDSPDKVTECAQTVGSLVDSVCHSVPFYLGNRTEPSTIADFTDPAILLPSHHSLARDDPRRPDLGTTPDEHKRHVVAQGPWNLMNPLSYLLTLFSEGHGRRLAGFLRQGQHEWLREQFLRVTVILHLSPARRGHGQARLCSADGTGEGRGDTRAENLARGVRKGAVYMSGA